MGVNKITHLISLQHFIQKHINDFGYYDLKGHYEAFLSKDVKKGTFHSIIKQAGIDKNEI